MALIYGRPHSSRSLRRTAPMYGGHLRRSLMASFARKVRISSHSVACATLRQSRAPCGQLSRAVLEADGFLLVFTGCSASRPFLQQTCRANSPRSEQTRRGRSKLAEVGANSPRSVRSAPVLLNVPRFIISAIAVLGVIPAASFGRRALESGNRQPQRARHTAEQAALTATRPCTFTRRHPAHLTHPRARAQTCVSFRGEAGAARGHYRVARGQRHQAS